MSRVRGAQRASQHSVNRVLRVVALYNLYVARFTDTQPGKQISRTSVRSFASINEQAEMIINFIIVKK